MEGPLEQDTWQENGGASSIDRPTDLISNYTNIYKYLKAFGLTEYEYSYASIV